MLEKKQLNCDVLIIGGGINGCGIAADAASRGLNVILCEKNDLAGATSSASSKLVHGGLRYLENYNVSFVRKALKEREVLFKICPYLIHPLAFVLPHQKSQRPFWLLRLGLFLYDNLCKTSVPKTRALNRKKQSSYFSSLKTNIKRALYYYDAQTIDSRLVIANALQAKQHKANILTRAQFISTIRNESNWHSKVTTKKNDLTIVSKLLVNATGPWADTLNQDININSPYHLSLVQGSHIVIDKLYEGDFAYLLQNDDKRIVFALPYHSKFTLIGTTERLIHDIPKTCSISNEETHYLLSLTNNYFNKKLTIKDIKHSYCGLRPLIKETTSKKEKDFSRDYKLFNNYDNAPYTCIYGGKLTTYRLLAKECVDNWQTIFPTMSPCQTKHSALPGSDFTNIKTLNKNLCCAFSQLPIELLQHYVSLYGSRTFDLLKNCTDLISLGQFFGEKLYQVEVDFLIETEWALTCEDIIWRRTKQGLVMNDLQIQRLTDYIQNIF